MKEAEELLAFMGNAQCVRAVVGNEGLVLIFNTDTRYKAWYFRGVYTTGQMGRRPRTAATILSMFGFGDVDEIFDRISSGDRYDYFEFVKND